MLKGLKSIKYIYIYMILTTTLSIIFSMFIAVFIGSVPIYADSSNGTGEQIKNTAQKIKDLASEVASNTTDDINSEEAKKILTDLGEAARKIAIGGADVLSNISGEIKSGLK